ncbi:hypothetical protein [Methylobacterium oryzihabitans]|uniref:Uncharacterized protein n=1 Tax=Methylobacterium oryzihabitans TaxID=2499852 RepID=A0A437NYE7_9HYPH|nr:hypothetical protein [Methylobacterium oryzihabitans]RVU15039.1 hypothetical protein EOE48_20755 [Methylobacterium oryzihabitans]
MRASFVAAGLLAGFLGLGVVGPAAAQSVGYVTGFPGKDPADDDGIGWGPAYRPETSFSQPGVPPTPGDFAGSAYRARTGRGPYDGIQAPIRPIRGIADPYGGYAATDPYGQGFAPPPRRSRAMMKAQRRAYERRHAIR